MKFNNKYIDIHIFKLGKVTFDILKLAPSQYKKISTKNFDLTITKFKDMHGLTFRNNMVVEILIFRTAIFIYFKNNASVVE